MTTLKQDPMILGLILIAGAMLYTRSTKARAVAQQPRGTGSMPGSAGTGLAQTLGGMLGNMFAGAASSGGANLPDWMLNGTQDSSYMNPANYTSDAVQNLMQYGI